MIDTSAVVVMTRKWYIGNSYMLTWKKSLFFYEGLSKGFGDRYSMRMSRTGPQVIGASHTHH